ncbi:hypothetical protein IIA79_00595 [bacterium]|nr:hypothetical protein [bacterium]
MHKYSSLAVFILAALAVCGCGGGSRLAGTESLPTHQDGVQNRFAAVLDSDASILGVAGAVLELAQAGGPVEAGGQIALRLYARELQGAKALIGRVDYDPASFHYVGSEPAGDSRLAGRDAHPPDRLLLCIDQPAESTVYFGWVLTNYDLRDGITGNLDICRLLFAPGPANVSKVTSKPPEGNGNAFTISGSLNEANVPTLDWQEAMQGDGDNNGEVNIADITPLALSFGATPNPVNPADSQARDADYDGNGEVNISDITPIGLNFGATLAGYVILSGPGAASLAELEELPRSIMFDPKPSTPDGELFWDWTGGAITEDTAFRVQPYDNDGVRGRESDNVVTLVFVPEVKAITDIVSITFSGSDTWPADNGDFVVLITELSVDDIDGNAEMIDQLVESLQLTATVEFDGDPADVGDGTSDVLWYLTGGPGLATVGNDFATKGMLTFHDRGRIEITAQVPGNFLLSETIWFVLLSIEGVELELAAGGGGPVNVDIGEGVSFQATGTFDWDGLDNGNEVTRDLTAYCNWACLPGPANGGICQINTGLGALITDGAASGDTYRISCEFPRTDNVTIGNNIKKVSEYLTVNIN